MGVRAQPSNERLRTNWTPEMDRYFIDLMLEQVQMGNRIDDHLFSKRAWGHMTALFNAKFRFQYEKNVLKNRHKTLRNLYRAIRNLLEQSGFSWDETREMVIAENHVWDDYIKEHPEARSYRMKTVSYYSDLSVMYSKTTTGGTEGTDKHSDDDIILDNNSSARQELESLNSLASPIECDDLVDNMLELSQFSMNTDITDQQNSSSTWRRSACKDTVNHLPEITTATAPVANEKEQKINSVSTENVFEALQPVPDISDPTVTNRSRTYWQPPMDRYFIDLMLDQVHQGNQNDGLFRKQAWMIMIANFNAKFGFKYDIEVLKNRYKSLRRQYSVLRSILDHNGFVWDDTRKMVTADDYVWQDYIKAHPYARQYMTRPVPYYNDLCMICRDLTVDGGNNCSGNDMGRISKVEISKESRNLQSPAVSVAQEDLVDYLQDSSSHLGGDIDASDQKNKCRFRASSTSQHSKKVRRSNCGGMMEAIREMASAVTSLADKNKENNNCNSVSIENVIEAVQAVPELDEELLLDACDFLEDEKMAKTFLALDVKLRKRWLVRKLRP
ncbi:L10-interacting MYB domain-containing protein-like [Telopea speciosissima]|uniref:L10-interacting MYB domain-containing protein-like n=1 Tax=Telopea speciosissima TaxID=54955 RepID=UPI001CC66335|nr:L10-interacting MYB domain-containing protein-like [Telopea speciosissima]